MTSNKKVCILYTGGTIGMVPTECGYAPKKDYFNTLLNQIHQMKSPALPSWDVVEFDPLLDSSNIAVEEWNNIGRTIFQPITAHWWKVFENLPKTVRSLPLPPNVIVEEQPLVLTQPAMIW